MKWKWPTVGKPFITDIGSGVVKLSEDGAMWTFLVDITMIILLVPGTINFSYWKTEDEHLFKLLLNFSKPPKDCPIAEYSGWTASPG